MQTITADSRPEVEVRPAIGPSTGLETSDQVLTFMLGQEEFGVDILRVQEIKGWVQSTRIPNTPDYIHGVMNLRGAVVPIVDLRRRLDLDVVECNSTTVIIVLKVECGGDADSRTMGFVVDAVSDVRDVTVDNIRSAPDFGDRVNTEFIRGLMVTDDEMVILLDIDRLVGADRTLSALGSAEHQPDIDPLSCQ